MGCAAGAAGPSAKVVPKGRFRVTPKAAPGGAKFPDVSNYQGCSINWARIPVPGAVVKADEYSQDPCFAHNVASLRAAPLNDDQVKDGLYVVPLEIVPA